MLTRLQVRSMSAGSRKTSSAPSRVTLAQENSASSAQPRSDGSDPVAQEVSMSNDREPLLQRENLSKIRTWRKWSIFACSCWLQFLLNLDMAAVAVALPVRYTVLESPAPRKE